METKQLYANGEAICPTGNYENDRAAEKIEQLFEEIISTLIEAKTYADSTYTQATGYTDNEIAKLIDGAPTTLATLGKIADAMAENNNVVVALDAAIGSKADEVDFQGHVTNNTVHITATERAKWNGQNEEIDTLKQSFRDGCNTLVSACTTYGATPTSNSPSDISTAIKKIYNDRYGSGRTQGQNDVKNNPNSYGLYSAAQYSAYGTNQYNAGYEAGKAAGTDIELKVNSTMTDYSAADQALGMVSGSLLVIIKNRSISSQSNTLNLNLKYNQNGTTNKVAIPISVQIL